MTKLQNDPDSIPVYSWCPDIEEEALGQMFKISKLPFVKHCALMPDAHLGMDMPIGGVVACENVIVPSFVGVDIGCGMAAMATSIRRKHLAGKEQEVLERLRAVVPVGFQHNSPARQIELESTRAQFSRMRYDTLGEHDETQPLECLNGTSLKDAYLSQVGTLGGGNHFLELQHDESGDRVCVMIHSGSRNIGKSVCDFFTARAEERNKQWWSNTTVPFFPADSLDGQTYIWYMKLALLFSLMNKTVMMDAVKKVLKEVIPDAGFGEPTIVHHNYAVMENHLGHNWWVHRKGAASAREGQVGIIPGSMGTPSYLTTGLGNPLSLNSSSHGAGRRMGRMEFNRSIDSAEKREEVAKSLEGVTHLPFTAPHGRGKKGERALIDCSEAPGAYKDIDTVMENQKDLVKSAVKLTPFLCLKG